ncbi:hypothetical protein Cadr_000024030 [Camelus dromedarius]|uniref:Uncharacterized protein n=1 Tax=Camelus dromedarius TaxID=9838 RepID=A0A5N4CWT2_CAMDR|nr:hypothetical protein Cadr_000024030 [Camelus dromedarius]
MQTRGDTACRRERWSVRATVDGPIRIRVTSCLLGPHRLFTGLLATSYRTRGPRVTEQAMAIKTRKARYDVQGWLRSFKENVETLGTSRFAGGDVKGICLQETSPPGLSCLFMGTLRGSTLPGRRCLCGGSHDTGWGWAALAAGVRPRIPETALALAAVPPLRTRAVAGINPRLTLSWNLLFQTSPAADRLGQPPKLRLPAQGGQRCVHSRLLTSRRAWTRNTHTHAHPHACAQTLLNEGLLYARVQELATWWGTGQPGPAFTELTAHKEVQADKQAVTTARAECRERAAQVFMLTLGDKGGRQGGRVERANLRVRSNGRGPTRGRNKIPGKRPLKTAQDLCICLALRSVPQMLQGPGKRVEEGRRYGGFPRAPGAVLLQRGT